HRPMRILLIDDHPIFRAGLELLLKELEPKAVVLHAGTCAEGIALARKKALNLAFLDLNLPDGNGLDCLKALKAVRPSLPVVVVSGQEMDRDLIEEALELKAMGFVPKSENADMVVAALRAALAGGVFLPSSVMGAGGSSTPASARRGEGEGAGPKRPVLPEPCKAVDLGITPRQVDVLRLLVQGLPNKRIATKLGISLPVVKKHVSDLLAHFQVMGRTQLVAWIARRGIYLGAPELSDPLDEVRLGEG
ncbi:partial Transcriptional regulatory protein DegU, partial [uncultured bacterium]